MFAATAVHCMSSCAGASSLTHFPKSPTKIRRLLRVTADAIPLAHNNLQGRRELSSFDSSPLSASGTIAWLCFVSVCVVTPLVCCFLYCGWNRREQEEAHRAEEQEQTNTDISRIEANVKRFTERQDKRRKRSIRLSHRKNIRVSGRLPYSYGACVQDQRILIAIACCSYPFLYLTDCYGGRSMLSPQGRRSG